ncbi:hypothetical protein MAMC_01605 [Methylacidimicrobium cyclopophantes]|uniref:Uncharacterized protein n=1 Tax=Methylacidimicrobium cyclopophantes TaxID=1041766 RepID=A0A5E6MEC0_9BACT|nr:hypothetical protein MAMC_01605 [Methylacidimicrobium cyclopophantes]
MLGQPDASKDPETGSIFAGYLIPGSIYSTIPLWVQETLPAIPPLLGSAMGNVQAPYTIPGGVFGATTVAGPASSLVYLRNITPAPIPVWMTTPLEGYSRSYSSP